MAFCTSARVALVISSLDAGGAERVMSTMANHWAARGGRITLVTIDAAATDFYKLHPSVNRIALGVAGNSYGFGDAVARNVHRISRLRAALRAARPSAVISFMHTTNVLSVIAGRLEGLPVIVSERSDPQRGAGMIWNQLRLRTYARAEAIVVQTPEARTWAEGFFPKAIIHTIPNPVIWPPEPVLSTSVRRSLEERTSRRVLAIGRLEQIKGFDVLLRAFAKCHAAFPNWSLTILGEGTERARLEALVSQLELTDVVELPGRVESPYEMLRDADLFVLSSRSEGFPNVLLEAMAAGVAVIATDCPSGPRNIVRDGLDGVLVPPENVDAMAEAMRALMQDDVRRQSLASRAEEARERFSVDRVMSEWERVVELVAPGVRRQVVA